MSFFATEWKFVWIKASSVVHLSCKRLESAKFKRTNQSRPPAPNPVKNQLLNAPWGTPPPPFLEKWRLSIKVNIMYDISNKAGCPNKLKFGSKIQWQKVVFIRFIQLKQYWRWELINLREDFPGKNTLSVIARIGTPSPLPKLILTLFFKSKKVAQTACRRRGNLHNAQKKGYFFLRRVP